LLGNQFCDNGDEEGEANFNCEQFYFDNNDCPVGLIYFGDVDLNSQNIPVYMDCFYPVDNYAISVSGLSGMSLSGGMVDDPSFQFEPQVFNDTSIAWTSTTNDMPANYGLIFYIEYDQIIGDICFDSSTITTVYYLILWIMKLFSFQKILILEKRIQTHLIQVLMSHSRF
jgi:hypothetical protein